MAGANRPARPCLWAEAQKWMTMSRRDLTALRTSAQDIEVSGPDERRTVQLQLTHQAHFFLGSLSTPVYICASQREHSMRRPLKRCPWAGTDPLYVRYHDREWGVPVHNDRRLFEMLILEGAQAGLSWITILKKRPAYRRAFDSFDPAKIALYKPSKIRS